MAAESCNSETASSDQAMKRQWGKRQVIGSMVGQVQNLKFLKNGMCGRPWSVDSRAENLFQSDTRLFSILCIYN